MPIQLDAAEARLLGSLVEKALTTPEQYPLTFHALTQACNQKTSREPVMELGPDAVGRAVQTLIDKGLAERANRAGERVPKFIHRVEHLLGGEKPSEVAALCFSGFPAAEEAAPAPAPPSDRLALLETRVAALESAVAELARRAGRP